MVVAWLVAWLVATVASVAVAAEPPPDLGLLEQQAFRSAVQRAAPSVVRIETVGGIERLGRLLLGSGPTTGLVLGSDGTIVSSAFNFLHRPASIVVCLADGTRKAARIVATDYNLMIVLLKIEPDRPLPVPEIAPLAEMRVGQWTIAMGRAFESDQPNIAVGVLSAVNRIWGKAIQTDAAVSPNNYGGPLVDIHGRMLGVLVPLSPIESSPVAGVEWYDSGIGFAVPAQTIVELLPRLRQGNALRPGLTGIQFVLESLYTADSTIPAVRPRSPARRAGLRAGDRIVAIDGHPVETAAQVKHQLARHYAGDTIRIAAVRGTERIERELELVDRIEPYEAPFVGILPTRAPRERSATREHNAPSKQNLTREQSATAVSGLKVRYVYPDSPAAQAGIQIGDVLVSAEGQSAADLAQWRLRLSAFEPGEQISLEIRRGDTPRKAAVILGKLPETIPTEPLPPGYETTRPDPSERPPVGAIQLALAGSDDSTWVYVPKNYHPNRPCGLVIWLPPPGEVKAEPIFALWQGPCERDGLIVAAPRSTSPARWQTRDAGIVALLAAKIAEQYSVDANRVVVCGRETGGTVAMAAGFRFAQWVRGVAAFDAPALGPIVEPHPARRLDFFLATAAGSPSAALVRQTIAQLRQLHYPVTVKDLGVESRELTADDIAELARWIDTLDRI